MHLREESSRFGVSGFGFLVIIGILELFFVFYNPPFASPDELSHLQYAKYFRDHLSLPDPYQEKKIQQDKHPPYAYLLGAVVMGRGDKVGEALGTIRLPGPFERTVDFGAISEHSGIPIYRLFLLRGVMALHWVVGAFFLFKMAKLMWPCLPKFSFGIALGFSAIPQVARIGASFSPDSPLMSFAAISFYYQMSLLKEWSIRKVFLASFFLGLALLTKSAAVCLIPLIPFLVIALWRGRSGQVALKSLAVLLVIPALMAGWWYLRNLILYGDLFQMRAQVETFTHSLRRSPVTPVFFEVFFEDIWRTFLGFDGRDTLLPHPLYYFFSGLFGVSFAGLLLLLKRSVREEVNGFQIVCASLGGICFGVMLLLTFLGNLSFHSPQGRYLFPALGGLMVFCGLGWRVALRLKMEDSYIFPCFSVGMVLLSIYSFNYSYLPRFYPKKSRIYNSGGVVYFYEDCGTPNLHPHRVQGFDIPDGSQEGRVVPWRTLDGHPNQVIYNFPLTKAQRENLQVRVTYFNPDPRVPFLARKKGHFVYPSQRLFANGSMLHEAIQLTSTPTTLVYPIPKKLVSEGMLELKFEKIEGLVATVAEIWLEKRWVSLENRSGGALLKNISSLSLDCSVFIDTGRGFSWKKLKIHPGVTSIAQYEDKDKGESFIRELAVCLLKFSPWVSLQAESFPSKGVSWYGARDAQGGYFLRGRGELCQLPPHISFNNKEQYVLFRAREKGKPWGLIKNRKGSHSIRLMQRKNGGESVISEGEGVDLDAILVLDGKVANQLQD